MSSNVIVFKYKGALKNGAKQKGIIIAETKEEAIELLEKRGIYVSKITKMPRFFVELMPIPHEQLALLFEGMAQMIRAGVPQIEAIEFLIKEQYNPKLALTLYEIKENLHKGLSLPNAFKETGKFPDEVVKMIEVGIESGKIVDVLESLKDYYRNMSSLMKGIKSASIYPAFISTIMLLVVFFGLPRITKPMEKFYKSVGKVDYPVLSKIVVKAVNVIGEIAPFVLIGTAVAVILIIRQYRNDYNFKKKIDNLLLKLPISSSFIERATLYKFLLSFTVLYKAGVPVAEAFKLISETMSNAIAREDFLKAVEDLKKGVNLEKVIRGSRFLSSRVKAVMVVGIESGSLDKNLEELLVFEKENFESYISFLKSLATPLLMIVIGVLVGIVIIAVYLPIFSMIDMMKHLH